MLKQRGFTLTELLILVWAVIAFGIIGTIIGIAWHFIAKFW